MREVIDRILAEEQQLRLEAAPLYGRIRETGHSPVMVSIKIGEATVTGTSFQVRDWAEALLMAVMASFWDSYVDTWTPPGDPERSRAAHEFLKANLVLHVKTMTPEEGDLHALRGGFGVASLLAPAPLVQITLSGAPFTVTAPKALRFASDLFAAAASAELTGGLYLACREAIGKDPGMSEASTQSFMRTVMDKIQAVQAETEAFARHLEQNPGPADNPGQEVP